MELLPTRFQQHYSCIYTANVLAPASSIEPFAVNTFTVRGIRRGIATKGSWTSSVEKMVDIFTDNHICVHH